MNDPFALYLEKGGSLRGSHEKQRDKLALADEGCQYDGVDRKKAKMIG